VYRHHIYFLSDEEAKERFIQSPQTFLQQVSPKPLVPIKVAIIGPPKSGKTTRKLEMLLILFLLFLLLLLLLLLLLFVFFIVVFLSDVKRTQQVHALGGPESHFYLPLPPSNKIRMLFVVFETILIVGSCNSPIPP